MNLEARHIGRVLLNARSVGAYESKPFYCYKGKRKDELSPFPSKGLITGVEGGVVTCGEFAAEQGMRYFVIVNRNVEKPTEAKPRLDWRQIRRMEIFDAMKATWRRCARRQLLLRLAPGDGVLLRAWLER